MKKSPILLGLMALALMFTGCSDQGSSETDAAQNENTEETTTDEKDTNTRSMVSYRLNPEQSVVKWKGTMLGVKEHTGTLQFAKGVVDVKGEQVVGGEVVVDMSTMQATDENYNPEEGQTKDKLIGHLQSADFFNVSEHPHARLAVKSMENGAIVGDLTIRGITHEIRAEVTDMHMHDNEMHVMAKTTFDRQRFNVAWEAMGDVVLSDEIELEIDLTAAAQ